MWQGHLVSPSKQLICIHPSNCISFCCHYHSWTELSSHCHSSITFTLSFCVIFLYPSKSQGRQDLKVRSIFAIFVIEARKTIHCSTLEQSFKIQRAWNAQVHPSISPYLSNLHFSGLQICLCVQSSTSLRKFSCMDATFCLLVRHTSSKGTFLFACLIIHCVWVAWKLQGLKFL